VVYTLLLLYCTQHRSAIIEKLKNYAADEDIEQVLSKDSIADGATEALLYTAIEASAADGEYNDGEKASVRKIAAKLEVSEDVVKQLEAYYEYISNMTRMQGHIRQLKKLLGQLRYWTLD
jgi:hypothetical protein